MRKITTIKSGDDTPSTSSTDPNLNKEEYEKYMVWDDLFGILAWKFKITRTGDFYLEGEVYNELKKKFELKRISNIRED